MYGCQRHMVDLPKPKIVTEENNVPEGAKMGASIAAGGAKGNVKSEKKKGLQKVKHESKPQADSPSLSPCPPNDANSSSNNGAGVNVQPPVARKMEPPSYRAGFLLGDGAGMVS